MSPAFVNRRNTKHNGRCCNQHLLPVVLHVYYYLVMKIKMLNDFLHLLFPHVCSGCGSDRVRQDSSLCLRCLAHLPETGFAGIAGNPIEKKFYGRLPLESAFSLYYFSHGSIVQQLMHEFKYKSNRDLGFQLGCFMGHAILESNRVEPAALVPLPLHPAREKKRGYNQARVLCDGIARITGWPILTNLVVRRRSTDSQTRKGRVDRWLNMEGNFRLHDEASAENRHLVLVDDVLTTGATLEACGETLLQARGVRLSLATLCYAWR